MHDTTHERPDHACLFAAASERHGYFTSAQARACGFSRFLLARHAQSGRYLRVRRGLYRLRDYPSSPHEELIAAWLALGHDVAVVSHDSALDLLGLSNVIPDAVHLTVPRSKRYLPKLPGVVVHTTSTPFGRLDLSQREGIRLTSATRTILDSAEAGTDPEQIARAIHQAVDRGLTTPSLLEQQADGRSRRVRDLIRGTLSRISP